MVKAVKKGNKVDRVSKTVVAFMALVNHFRYQQGIRPRSVPLTNFTFWAGAGFSKSWDKNAPVGDQLFKLDSKNLEGVANSAVLSRLFGLSYGDIDPKDLRQIIYQLDMSERYPDVCSRYLDPQNIRIIRAGLCAAVVKKYSELASINYFDPSLEKFPISSPSREQIAILRFFRHLHECADGSGEFSEGIRCHFATTNYDFVIETILDNILAPDDSLFLYTYRGFTPSSILKITNPVPTHQHWLTWHLIKLNGGFEILREGDRYRLDYDDRTQEQIMSQPPVLMLPSREQDYSDPYFRTIFPKAVRLMRDTRVLVLVGYSLPEDDALMRFIVRQFAEEAEDGREKVIFYVDPLPEAEKLSRLRAVFPSIEQRSGAPTVFTYEGGFADFAAECVSQIKDPLL